MRWKKRFTPFLYSIHSTVLIIYTFYFPFLSIFFSLSIYSEYLSSKHFQLNYVNVEDTNLCRQSAPNEGFTHTDSHTQTVALCFTDSVPTPLRPIQRHCTAAMEKTDKFCPDPPRESNKGPQARQPNGPPPQTPPLPIPPPSHDRSPSRPIRIRTVNFSLEQLSRPQRSHRRLFAKVPPRVRGIYSPSSAQCLL